jgi:hypothetical protein
MRIFVLILNLTSIVLPLKFIIHAYRYILIVNILNVDHLIKNAPIFPLFFLLLYVHFLMIVLIDQTDFYLPTLLVRRGDKITLFSKC